MTPNPFSSLPPPDLGSEQILQAKQAALGEAVEKAYKVYEGLDIVYNSSQIGGLEKQILSPAQIDSLLQVIKSEAEPMKLRDQTTGKYLNKLIKYSYYAGNNDFVLTTGDTNINYIAIRLSGSKEKRLKIRIDGNAGDWCGAHAHYSEITIYGNAGYGCGMDAHHTTFNAHNKRTYNMFKNNVRKNRKNIICLLDSSSKVIKEEEMLWQ